MLMSLKVILVMAVLILALAWFGLRTSQTTSVLPAPVLPELDRAALVLENRRLRQTNATGPFTGWMTTFYPGGTLQSRSFVSNGVLHGVSQGWFTNGVLQIVEQFENGVSHGTRVKYFDSGATQSVGQIQQGKMEGAFVRYHEQGGIAERISLSNGLPHGDSFAYHPNGRIKARAKLDQGQVVESQNFNEQGEPVTNKTR
ncbi:MAG: toxin-antitoxin system YwqK family antitoxin [Verrucomicrobia bacterium]|nr:toxin-antitoxin system YwqK family antitoxin [Verrucomicrobiota bacterium]